MVDVIGEIISIEKQAEEIVENARRESERILAEAARRKEQERIRYENEVSTEVEKYHDDLRKSGTEHLSAANSECEAMISRLDEQMKINGDKWADEIFSAVICAD